MTSKIKLLALDLDGTLLHTDKSVSQTNRQAIHRAIDAGIRVVLASGRMHYSTLKYAQQMDFTPESFIVSYSGALARTIGDSTPVYERTLDAEYAKELVRFAADHGLHLNYYLHDILYTVEHDWWSDLYESRTGCKSEFVGDLTRFDDESPSKVIIIAEKEITFPLQTNMSERFGDSVQVLITDDEYLEFMDPEATKGNALKAIAALLDIQAEECVAMGDNNNDLSMLEWAGRGIAMANGRPELLKKISEHAPPADEDGVAQVIAGLLT